MNWYSKAGMIVGIGCLSIGLSVTAVYSTKADELPNEKQKIEDHLNKMMEDAKSRPQATKPKNPALLPEPHLDHPHGIMNDFSVPFSPAEVRISNVYQTELNGNFVQVYAGATSNEEQQPSDQGVDIVKVSKNNGSFVRAALM